MTALEASPSLTSMAHCDSLRNQLEAFALPKDPHIYEVKKFFLRSDILNLFTHDVVTRVLACECQRCQRVQHVVGLTRRTVQPLVKAILGNQKEHERHTTYHLTLALCVAIDRPALIASFVRHKCNDSSFEATLKQLAPDEFQEKFWPSLYHSNRQDSEALSRKVRWQKYRFFVPVLRDGEFSTFDENTILPFLNERRVGHVTEDGATLFEGAYGQVYSFEIPEEYRNFASLPNVNHFVRKELRDNDKSGIFNAERSNLDYIQHIKDDHLVKVVKAYKHGHVGNIIFPRAITNLGHYLRDARFNASKSTVSCIEDHPFWGQMIGLARALHKILDYEADGATRDIILYGYHFDLKPSNILVDESNKLIISDFGQAHFRKAGATSSKVVGFGGTESYAPPEIDDADMRQNRRYDIWSLGCIFLELITFVTMGHAGVHELDSLRLSTSADLSKTDDRFFVRRGNDCSLKPAIIEWMDQLPGNCNAKSSSSFVKRWISVVRRMLSVSIQERCTSQELCCDLSDIVSTGSYQKKQQVSRASILPTLECNGIEIGSDPMLRAHDIKYHLGYWNSGPIRFVRGRDQLSMYTLESEVWIETSIGPIRDLKLVPRYAMKDSSQHRYQDSSLFLVGSSSATPPQHYSQKFWAKTEANNFALQETLTSQRVVKHIIAKRVSFSLAYSPRTRDLLHKALNLGPKLARSIFEDFATIQLWNESIRTFVSGSDGLHESYHHSMYKSPSPRRLVILSSTAIYVFRIDNLMRLSDLNPHSKTLRPLHFIPVDKAGGAFFPCLIIKKDPREVMPGLPLSRRSLEFEEETKTVRMSMLKIDFETNDEMQAFKDAYRALKFQWTTENKSLSQIQRYIGPGLGYARNGR